MHENRDSPLLRGGNDRCAMYQHILLAVALQRWDTVSPYALIAREAAVALAKGAKRELARLSKLPRKALEWHYLKINPMAGVKLLKEPPGRLRYLEPEEFDTLYGAVEDLASWLKPIVQVALLTGMRRNEILTLRWNHVNLRDAMVTLPQTKNNDLRVVPLSRVARDILAAVPRHVSHAFVFVNAGTGRPWDPFYVSHTFARVCRLAGIPNCRFHDLRHTFASHLVMRGTDLKTVQQLLGHRDIRMTLRYAHLSQTHLRESVEKLSAAYRLSDNLVTSAGHQSGNEVGA